MPIHKILTLLLLIIIGISCTKNEDDQNKEAKILSYQIVEMPQVSFKINDLNITAKVPYSIDLTQLTASFTLTKKAQLFIGNVEQVTGETKNDFTQAIQYTIKGADSDVKTYTVTIIKEQNIAPIANAGLDQSRILSDNQTSQKIELSAYLSEDPDGEIVKYTWHEGSVFLGEGETLEVDLTEGTHTITLTVEDNSGAKAEDKVAISILKRGNFTPIDSEATQATRNLFNNLGKIAHSDQFIFGQEFPMSFKLGGLRYDLSTSDSKLVTGDHPGVFGIDPHYMLYKGPAQKQLHIDEAKYAYNNGAVITFDFHQESRNDHKLYIKEITTPSDKSLMYDIVNDKNGSREWFYGEMDQIISMINNDLGFPVVFRLFHEMNGGWFWWGNSGTNHSSELYKDFFRLSVSYIKERSNLVLFSWSPNYPFNNTYYPGNDYVDIIGVDTYEPKLNELTALLKDISAFALANNKIAAITEIGQRDNYTINHPNFWTSTVLKAIKDGGNEIKIAWVLTWFNAPWKSSQDDLFIPNSASNSSVKNDFILFKNDRQTLFLEDVKQLKMYDE